MDTLVSKLVSRDLLLVWDNCERLVPTCAQLADGLLAGCPNVRLLVTSREPLQIAGEITWRVRPLAVPDLQHAASLGELAESPAVRLFVARAQAVQPAFTLTPQTASAIGKICRRVDGLPLGIELAAARLRALGVEEILERLNASFRVLVGSPRSGPDRHQTLRATLDWSHALLTPHEQAVFCRLAVFAGGWSLEAAETVCAGDPVERAEVLDVLSRLVDKSLVVMDERGGRAHYRLLDSVREYAGDQLRTSGEEETTHARHVAYFLELAEALAGWARLDHVLEVVGHELDNLRAALRWCVDQPAPDVGLRLARGCMVFWHARALYEGRMWLSRLLALPGADQPTVARAAALGCFGLLAIRRGDFAAARVLHEQALATARLVGDPHQLFSNLWDSAFGELHRGEYALAQQHLEEAVATARAAGDPVTEAVGLSSLGWLAFWQSDITTAQRYGDECLRLARRIDDLWLIGCALNTLGLVALEQGDTATARRRFEESLPIRRQVGYQGDTAETLDGLARVALAQQRQADARALFAESLRLRREDGEVVMIARSLEGIAALAAALGQPDRALCLAGAAEAVRTSIGAPMHPQERVRRAGWLDPLTSLLGPETIAQGLAAGGHLSLDQAVALALEPPEIAQAAAPGSAGRERTGTLPLSAREQEVAALLAQGLSNRQIAERLVITERTVAAHVEHILDKLGFSSRTQIALWAAEHHRLTHSPV